jgi:hypothetical protein
MAPGLVQLFHAIHGDLIATDNQRIRVSGRHGGGLSNSQP